MILNLALLVLCGEGTTQGRGVGRALGQRTRRVRFERKSTPRHANLTQASTSVLSASTTSISIEVFTFEGTANVDDSFSVIVDLGQ